MRPRSKTGTKHTRPSRRCPQWLTTTVLPASFAVAFRSRESSEKRKSPLPNPKCANEGRSAGERKNPPGDNLASEPRQGQQTFHHPIHLGFLPSERTVAASGNGWHPRGRPPAPFGGQLSWQTRVPATPQHPAPPHPPQNARLRSRGRCRYAPQLHFRSFFFPIVEG